MMPRGALHGNRPISGLDTGLDEGAAEAYADELLLHFGLEDEFLEDDDLVELFGDDDEDEDEDDEDEDEDDEDEDDDEGFGGTEVWPSRVLSADRQRFGAFRPLSGLAKTVGAASNFAAQAGQGLSASGYQVFAPPPPIVLVDTPLAPPPSQAQVVSDRSSLPPVYVADPALAEQAAKSPAVESSAVMAPSTKFGASFQEGSVRPRSGKDKQAIVAGRLLSEKELRRSEAGRPTSFVEDGNASPLLHQDGTFSEPVHGKLTLVSCMSCGSLPAGRYGASGSGCLVCEDYGAILVPTSDLPNLVSAERFGFVGALLSATAALAAPVGQLAGGAVGARKQQASQDTAARAQKVYDRLRKQIADKSAVEAKSSPQEAPLPSQPDEKVSGLGGDLGDLDDLEDLDLEEDLDDEDSFEESFGDDFEEVLDEAFGAEDSDLDDDFDDLDLEEEEEDDGSSEGRIVRILFPRGRFDR